MFRNIFKSWDAFELIIGTIFDLFKAKMLKIVDSSSQIKWVFYAKYPCTKNRAIFFSGTLWLSRAKIFVIFSKALFWLSRVSFSKSFLGIKRLSRSLFWLVSAFLSGIFNFLVQNFRFFWQFLLFLDKKITVIMNSFKVHLDDIVSLLA